MDTTPRRSTRLQAALQEGRSGFSPILESASAAHTSAPKQCGACLLDVDTASKEGEFVAVLDSCNPTHFFHVRCISTWAEQENTCPLCKNRFSRVGVYGVNGDLRRIITAEEKDQNSEGETSAEFEDHVCSICKRPGGDDALLLCDGRNGRCRGAAHFYCLGLPGVPEGDWFCAECQEFPLSEFVQDAVEDNQKPLGANLKEVAPESKSSAAKRSPSQSPTANRKPTPKKSKSGSCRDHETADTADTAEQDHVLRSSSSKRPPSDAPSTLGSNPTPDTPAVPKWIYRKGPCLFVDLGGRRIKDSAAATVAKFLQSVLERVREVALDLCLLLAGNRLGRSGLEAFLNVAKETGHHVSCLDVERNRLDPDAMQWLAEWLTRQRRGPPQKILLSYNRSIGDEAAKDFLQLLGRSQSGREIPLWIEARFVGIKDIDTLLDALSVDINLCMALDSDACCPGRCASHSANEPGPHLHLPGILDQHSNSELIPVVQETSKAKTWKRSLSEARASQEGERARPSREPEEPGDSQASQASQVEAELLESLEQERAQRKAWANSLGRSVAAEMPSQVQDLPAPAPSYGLWDLVRAEQRKKRRSVGHMGS